MMNERERRDLEELRAYYHNVQKAIEEIQASMNKIDLTACTNKGEIALAAGAAAFAAYKDSLNKLFEAQRV